MQHQIVYACCQTGHQSRIALTMRTRDHSNDVAACEDRVDFLAKPVFNHQYQRDPRVRHRSTLGETHVELISLHVKLLLHAGDVRVIHIGAIEILTADVSVDIDERTGGGDDRALVADRILVEKSGRGVAPQLDLVHVEAGLREVVQFVPED